MSFNSNSNSNSNIFYLSKQTELSRHLKDTTPAIIHKLFYFSQQYFFKTPEMGAQTTIYCATEPELAKVSGLYYE